MRKQLADAHIDLRSALGHPLMPGETGLPDSGAVARPGVRAPTCTWRQIRLNIIVDGGWRGDQSDRRTGNGRRRLSAKPFNPARALGAHPGIMLRRSEMPVVSSPEVGDARLLCFDGWVFRSGASAD